MQAKQDYVESFTSRLLRPEGSGSDSMNQLSAEEDDIIMNCGGGLYAGAGDTVSDSRLISRSATG